MAKIKFNARGYVENFVSVPELETKEDFLTIVRGVIESIYTRPPIQDRPPEHPLLFAGVPGGGMAQAMFDGCFYMRDGHTKDILCARMGAWVMSRTMEFGVPHWLAFVTETWMKIEQAPPGTEVTEAFLEEHLAQRRSLRHDPEAYTAAALLVSELDVAQMTMGLVEFGPFGTRLLPGEWSEMHHVRGRFPDVLQMTCCFLQGLEPRPLPMLAPPPQEK